MENGLKALLVRDDTCMTGRQMEEVTEDEDIESEDGDETSSSTSTASDEESEGKRGIRNDVQLTSREESAKLVMDNETLADCVADNELVFAN